MFSIISLLKGILLGYEKLDIKEALVCIAQKWATVILIVTQTICLHQACIPLRLSYTNSIVIRCLPLPPPLQLIPDNHHHPCEKCTAQISFTFLPSYHKPVPLSS